MSTTVTARAHVDSWVEHDSPGANHGQGSKIRLRADDTGHERLGLVFFGRPFPPGATIRSATLTVYLKGAAWSGTHTIRVKRITDSWKENHVTYNNQPNVAGANFGSLVVVDGNDGDAAEIDITDLFADVSAGDDYHGLQLSISEDSAVALYSSESPKADTNPTLEVEWTEAPYPPSNLQPAGDLAVSSATTRLAWRFSDTLGSTKQSASQVQISTSSSFASPVYDSGKQTNVRHEWNLAGEYTLVDGTTYWWRCRVWDDSNLGSGWSDAAQFQRAIKGTLTITNPPAGPGNQVDDVTPPITWDSSVDLDRVRLLLDEVKPNGSLVELCEFPEQKVEAGFNTITLEKRKHGKVEALITSGKTYRVRLFGWDTVDRQSTPGDPDFMFAQRDFTYARDGTPAPVATLTATPLGAAVVLHWTRTAAPDYFSLRVDGVEVLPRIDPDDVMVSAGVYQMRWWRAISGVSHTYEVEAVVIQTGKKHHSSGNPTANATTKVTGKYLVDEDDDLFIFIEGAEQASLPIAESGTSFRLPGNRRPVRITDSIGGHEGTVSGVLEPGGENDFLELKGRVNSTFRYIQSKMNIPVEMGEGDVSPDSSRIGNFYTVSFDVAQVDEFFEAEGVEGLAS
jgi:hypothetical protein